MIEFDENGMPNRDVLMVQAQVYFAVAKNYENDSNLTLQWLSGEAPWITYLPYANGGGSILDNRPIFYVVEFYITPFDRLIWDAPEQSLVTDLSPGRTMGFSMSMTDKDEDPGRGQFLPDRSHALNGPDASWENLSWTSDLWADGILLGAGGRIDGTAVESITWGRIKASLSE